MGRGRNNEMTMKDKDQEYLRQAIALARAGVSKGDGGPFGAVIVNALGEVVGRGWNRVLATNDPTAHAEMTAIRDACGNLDHFQLEGCTIYSTSEPCPMCLGAIYWARPARLVFACLRTDAARIGFDDQLIYQEINLPFEERGIPTEHVPVDGSDAPLQDWEEKEDKILF